ncbi:nucleoside triphosphate pyrophosphohydrolase [Pseudalkalibacillus hwajinpoensis]|uniref:Phosphoribosyl-ATP pyrophosphohydrolase n=1 Tax=Guptibacillus hwajinpoensis TaxID=208199 RepID=A0A4U1MJN0_9BACL|nr:nucleoside triphosphate pyrophosphohydrolase [Pseudalkalibacillus hwajinpoensis]TKD70682.1 phosphoribosyl-ATP pyrophosphohydrolase [Pseudalkalibacillus hwajinpoensis]
MSVYNKLVRDRIPEIISNTGKTYETRILTDDEYRSALRKKLLEETNEFLESESDEEAITELADVLEVIHMLTKSHGTSIEEVENVRKRKADERGSFNGKIYLLSVED